MVERPIKKSELQKRAKTEGQTDDGKASNPKARKGGRGKGRDNKEKKKPATPLALMRGPRPTAKVEAPESVEGPEETAADGEGTEVVAEATETAAGEATEPVAEATATESAAADPPSDAVDADSNKTDAADASTDN